MIKISVEMGGGMEAGKNDSLREVSRELSINLSNLSVRHLH